MITSLKVENFRGFKNLEIPQFYGINLFLGVNDSGKSGLLKLLYATLKATRTYFNLDEQKRSPNYGELLIKKLTYTFDPRINGLQELASVGSGNYVVTVEIDINTLTPPRIGFKLDTSRLSKSNRKESKYEWHLEEKTTEFPDSFFLPPKEVLTVYQDIIYARDKGERLGFDDTYYDLVQALSRSRQKGKPHGNFTLVTKRLEGLFPGHKIKYDDKLEDFVYELHGKRLSIPMAAEGIRKIGILTQLIRNKEIIPGVTLFIDEPETALHPIATREFMRMIFDLSTVSGGGIQIFMASHDSFVLKELELLAKEKDVAIGCYSLLKNQGQEVQLDWADLRDRIPQNEIIDESVRIFEDRLKYQIEHGK